jgi:SAM-dependent methyltransferase
VAEPASYLLAGQASELERLQLQSRVWEPAGKALLAELAPPAGARAVDVGCGMLGWLRVLSRWVGPEGHVVGTDVDAKMLSGAEAFVAAEALGNVSLVRDDLFQSALPADVVRPGPCPLPDRAVGARRRADGRLPPAAAAGRNAGARGSGHGVLARPSRRARGAGADRADRARLSRRRGNFNSGRKLPELVRGIGLEPRIRARVVALEPAHPYLRLPLQFAASLRPRLEALMPPAELAALLQEVEAELARPHAWGTTFTLIQVLAAAP